MSAIEPRGEWTTIPPVHGAKGIGPVEPRASTRP
ncbi:hypothetical protein Ae406Ps2_3818 [Pseudonocardia sp. Ae406_Ps2]|nr:hypothetical protein Ae331Ps2_2123c [Pseudonocardia sp. Ae331_Ps2]OLM03818.1 hypothetical protein Ae406Ps2_3818 [Pseudonocardia sp. Ae406_Ps2]OLM25375.1 hypothetical protein Ae706Ps2_3808 [Pseudonocardia sp. Ae706_Ps2]